jgi:hypothetical protein
MIKSLTRLTCLLLIPCLLTTILPAAQRSILASPVQEELFCQDALGAPATSHSGWIRLKIHEPLIGWLYKAFVGTEPTYKMYVPASDAPQLVQTVTKQVADLQLRIFSHVLLADIKRVTVDEVIDIRESAIEGLAHFGERLLESDLSGALFKEQFGSLLSALVPEYHGATLMHDLLDVSCEWILQDGCLRPCDVQCIVRHSDQSISIWDGLLLGCCRSTHPVRCSDGYGSPCIVRLFGPVANVLRRWPCFMD